jgi:hypothetical protein
LKLSSADRSFGIIAMHKKLLDRSQVAFLEGELEKSRSSGETASLEEICLRIGLLDESALERITSTRARHGRSCLDCGGLTFLLPGQRSQEIPCEHCKGPLAGGRIDSPPVTPKPISRKNQPSAPKNPEAEYRALLERCASEDDADLFVRTAGLAADLGHVDQAKMLLKKALVLVPNHPFARRRYEDMGVAFPGSKTLTENDFNDRKVSPPNADSPIGPPIQAPPSPASAATLANNPPPLRPIPRPHDASPNALAPVARLVSPPPAPRAAPSNQRPTADPSRPPPRPAAPPRPPTQAPSPSPARAAPLPREAADPASQTLSFGPAELDFVDELPGEQQSRSASAPQPPRPTPTPTPSHDPALESLDFQDAHEFLAASQGQSPAAVDDDLGFRSIAEPAEQAREARPASIPADRGPPPPQRDPRPIERGLPKKSPSDVVKPAVSNRAKIYQDWVASEPTAAQQATAAAPKPSADSFEQAVDETPPEPLGALLTGEPEAQGSSPPPRRSTGFYPSSDPTQSPAAKPVRAPSSSSYETPTPPAQAPSPEPYGGGDPYSAPVPYSGPVNEVYSDIPTMPMAAPEVQPNDSPTLALPPSAPHGDLKQGRVSDLAPYDSGQKDYAGKAVPSANPADDEALWGPVDTRPVIPPFTLDLGDTLTYALTPFGLAAIFGGAILLAASGGCFGILKILPMLYVLTFYGKIINSAASGGREMPDWPDITEVQRGVSLLLVYLVCWGVVFCTGILGVGTAVASADYSGFSAAQRNKVVGKNFGKVTFLDTSGDPYTLDRLTGQRFVLVLSGLSTRFLDDEDKSNSEVLTKDPVYKILSDAARSGLKIGYVIDDPNLALYDENASCALFYYPREGRSELLQSLPFGGPYFLFLDEQGQCRSVSILNEYLDDDDELRPDDLKRALQSFQKKGTTGPGVSILPSLRNLAAVLGLVATIVVTVVFMLVYYPVATLMTSLLGDWTIVFRFPAVIRTIFTLSHDYLFKFLPLWAGIYVGSTIVERIFAVVVQTTLMAGQSLEGAIIMAIVAALFSGFFGQMVFVYGLLTTGHVLGRIYYHNQDRLGWFR